MKESSKNLGRLISTHGTAPLYLQRAAIVAVLSFFFFLAMIVAFYIRQNIGYFILSTAFLVVYVLMMVSWVLQKRAIVSIFENGLRYKKFSGSWDEIQASIVDEKAGRQHIELQKNGRERIVIPSSIDGFDRIAAVLNAKAL